MESERVVCLSEVGVNVTEVLVAECRNPDRTIKVGLKFDWFQHCNTLDDLSMGLQKVDGGRHAGIHLHVRDDDDDGF